MRALQLSQSIPRYLLTRAVGAFHRPAFWGPLAMLRYREVPEPALPGPEWVRVRTRYGGICGSDLRTVMLEDSPMLSAYISFPFTLGHENVGAIEEVGPRVEGFALGDRVVVEPLLPCAVRGLEPCEFCRRGDYSLCLSFTEGALAPGLGIGSCRDTGGSWSPCFVAHQSQLYRLAERVSDEQGVMVDSFCSALHPVLRNPPEDGDNVLVLGAGVVGLCTVAALRVLGSRARVLVVAKYPFQGEMARKAGADQVICLQGGDYFQAIAQATGARVRRPLLGRRVLVGGADVIYECTGTDRSIDDSLRLARNGGRVVLIGLAGTPKGVDWTPVWLKELAIKGSFWCSIERLDGRRVPAFRLALDWLAEGRLDLGWMVTHRFQLDEYARALAVTAAKGRHGVVKSVFVFD